MKICPACRQQLKRGPADYWHTWVCNHCRALWREESNEELMLAPCPVPECEHFEMAT
jgi:Zn-finger nucleic acid-binding protein